MSQSDINMEFTEQDDRAHHADNQTDPYFDMSTSAPLTPFNSIVQSLPSDGLGASESMSELPMSSLSPPTSLARALSTSPRLFHTTKDSCSTGDVHKQAYEDLDESGSSTIFPTSGFELMSTSVPINIPSPGNKYRAPGRRQNVQASTSVPNDRHLKKLSSVPSKNDAGKSYPSGNGQLKAEHKGSRLSVASSVTGGQHRKGSRLSVASSSIGQFRSSLFGSSVFGSPSRKSSTSSVQRINVVTEAMSVFPSFISIYSMESNETTEVEQQLEEDEEDVVIANHEYGFESVASYQDSLNCLNEKQSIGGLNGEMGTVDASALKRSVSMPPQYEYHNQTKRKVFGVKEVKEVLKDQTPKEEAPPTEDKETEDEVGELKLTATTPAKRKWQQTMPDLIEGPESETLTSQSSGRLLLAKAALAIVRGEYDVKTELADVEEMDENEEILFVKTERRKYMKNLLILCLSFFFVFMPYLSLRNLQSSLNAADGLGLYSLSCLYACFFVGCIFATTLVQRMRPKWTMLMCMCAMFLFDLVNFYPTFYTLIPMSGVVGFGLGVIWTAHATYLTNIASSYAVLTDKKIQEVLLRFNSIHFVFYQSAQIVGGLISSAVLNNSGGGGEIFSNVSFSTTSRGVEFSTMNGTEFDDSVSFIFVTNVSDVKELSELRCGTSYCPGGYAGPTSKQEISVGTVYMLVGIFTGCTFVGIMILLLFLDRLEGVMKKSHATLGKQLGAVFRFYADRRVVCLLGIMFYSMLQSSFMFGEYTKSFVTCALGVHMVGYVMVVLSASSALSAFVNGKVQKFVGRCPLILIAIALQAAMIIMLFLWHPSPDAPSLIFVVVIFWGMADGIIVTQTVCLIGVLFSNNKEPAFAALKMTQSVALFGFFMSSQYLCTQVKVIVVGTTLVLATAGYLMLEISLRLEKKKKKAREAVCDVKIVTEKSLKQPINA